MKIARLSQAREEVLDRKSAGQAEIAEKVKGIIQEVKARGDEALKGFSLKFDGVALGEIEVSEAEKKEALAKIDSELLKALKRIKKNLEATAKEQLPRDWRKKLPWGEVGQAFTPIEKVGIYAPGGRAVYPSSVLMAAVPANAAGVKDLVLCTPPGKDGKANRVIIAAAEICGVKRVFKVGGAQAIAAMAFGTKTVPKVLKIVGPGNAWVTEAKMIARSEGVEIDVPAGPSEVLLIADDASDAGLIALDLIAQAEHDPDAQSIAIVPSEKKAKEVSLEVDKELAKAARREIAGKSLEKNGFILIGSLNEAVDFANEYAAEHLQLSVKNADEVAKRIRNAGSIFLGEVSAVPFGDYNAGSNHVLPTAGMAKRFSGLSAASFVKASYVTKVSGKGAGMLAGDAALLARAEGLEGHAKAIEARKKKK